MAAMRVTVVALVGLVGLLGPASTACTLSHGGSLGPPPLDSSGSVGTDQLTPSFSAVDFGDGVGVHVSAALVARDGDFVELTSGDSLDATIGMLTDPLGASPGVYPDGSVQYTATFPSSMTASPVTVALDRGQGTPAPDSSTVVPAPFTIETTAPPHVSSPHTYTMLLSVNPSVATASGESWELEASGDCIQPFVASTADGSLTINVRGQVVFDASKLTFLPDGIGCVLTVYVSHVHAGAYDPAFSGPVPGQSLDREDPFASTASFRGVQARSWNTVLLSP
jgi:hypothetical protein